MSLLNETHNPQLSSWVESANHASDFPIQNLPYAIFRCKGSKEAFRGGVAIGDQVLDMSALAQTELIKGPAQQAIEASTETTLNHLMELGHDKHSALRLELSRALRHGSKLQAQLQDCLISQSDVEFDLPCRIGDYTDFYSSIHHASRVGALFRPDKPLLPNYKWIPIAYHGRSSSIKPSGLAFHRPVAQTKASNPDEKPNFGPSQRLDFELEVGILIGQSTSLGDRVAIDHAENHIFGLCLFNDLSARDIQAWEYQPLGPFLGKNFASSISPWVITREALAPYRMGFAHPENDPRSMPYLDSEFNSQYGAIDIDLECYIQTEKMFRAGQAAVKLTSSNFKQSYWTAAQMIAHHSVSGCSLNAGDLFGSGTQSGPTLTESGSLLELSQGGNKPITLPNGERRTFLEDGDTIVLRGHCRRSGAASIGFGEVVCKVLPAK